MKALKLTLSEDFELKLTKHDALFELENNSSKIEIEAVVDDSLTYELHIQNGMQKNVYFLDKTETGLEISLTDGMLNRSGRLGIQLRAFRGEDESYYAIESNRIDFIVKDFINASGSMPVNTLNAFERVLLQVEAINTLDVVPTSDGADIKWKGETVHIANGRDGRDGKDGTDGKNGVDGRDGKDGTDGKNGVDGRDGKDGAPGERGPAGERGPQGERGLPGEVGPQGPQGPEGPMGPQGPAGESAVQDVQINGTSILNEGVADITGLASQSELDTVKADLSELASATVIEKTIENKRTISSTWNDGLINPNGSITTSTAYIYSDVIPVVAGESVTIYKQNTDIVSPIYRICATKDGAWDGNYVVVNGRPPYIVPDGYDGIRVSISGAYKSTVPYFEITSESTELEPIDRGDIEALKRYSISETETEATFTRNLNSYINANNKKITALNGYFYSDVYALEKGNTIIVTSKDASGSAVARVSKWNKDGTVCSKVLDKGTTAPTTYKYTATEPIEYLRFSGQNTQPFDVILQTLVIPEKFQTVLDDYEKQIYSSLSMFEKIAFCGDSYVKAQIWSDSGVIGDKPNLSWGSCIGRLNGIEAHIYASSGADTNTWQTRSDCLPKALSESACGLYVFCMGINDSTYVTLGTIADVHEDYTTNPNTFYGNYGKIIAQIKAHAPESKIIIMTPYHPSYNERYVVPLKEITEYLGVMMIDTTKSVFCQSGAFVDRLVGGHPTAPLHGAMAKDITNLIDECISKNYDYFKSYFGLNS